MSLIRRNSDRAWGTCVSHEKELCRGFRAKREKYFLDRQQNFFKPKILAAGLTKFSKNKNRVFLEVP